MMLNFLLPFVIASPGFLSGVAGLTESILISDTFSITAEYAPQGSTLQKEGMVLSIEDFAVLQAEVESSAGACQTRLDDLRQKQEETIGEMQERCAERNSSLNSKLNETLSLNKRLTEDLKRSETNLRFQKWLNLSLVVGATITTTIVLTR